MSDYKNPSWINDRPVWFSDAAHAWLRVSYKALAAAGMGVSDFSPYSYYSDIQDCVWLEEDCDAGKFLARLPRAQRDDIDEIHLNDSSDRNEVRRQRRIGAIKI